MASVWSHPKTQNLIARYRGAEGKTVNRSTGTPDKAEALRIAKTWEIEAAREREKKAQEGRENVSSGGIADAIARAERLARQGRLNGALMRDIINSALAAGGLETVEAVTSQAWIETWKKSKAGSVTLRTKWKFDQRANEWLRFLGPKADKTLEMVTKDDAVAYRDHLAHQGLSAQTANHAVKLLRGIHEEALRQGHISRNPFAGVGRLKEDTEGTRREPFTQREVAKLIEAADGDWRGLIILAGTSALRLMDAARLKWSSIDLETGWIRIKTSKTGAKLMLPIHDDLAAWLKTQPRGIGQAPLFPALAEKGGAGKSGLSMCFRRLMNRAGVSAGVAREGEGRGRTTARKSFHSLRHFAASQMAQGGVRNEIARSITGHSDTASHEGYITADADALRSAVNTIRLSA